MQNQQKITAGPSNRINPAPPQRIDPFRRTPDSFFAARGRRHSVAVMSTIDEDLQN